MERQSRWVIGFVAAVLFALLAWRFWPQVGERFEPRPLRARVAIEVEGAGSAVVGRVEMPTGTRFFLHAVLEAEGRGGERVYYTEATRLILDGQEVPAPALRRWNRRETVRVRWFTVEGFTPYLEVGSAAELDRFRFEELFRSDWPFAWRVSGVVAGRSAAVRAGAPELVPEFGTQRYHVRVELYERAEDLAPVARFASPGAAELTAGPSDLPTVRAGLPGPLGAAAAVFGLTQIEAAATAPPDLAERLRRLEAQEFAFSRLPLLAAVIEAAGHRSEALSWRTVIAEGERGALWIEQVAPGDLVQSGDRTVILYRDLGVPGLLDPADLVLDFARGAKIAPLAAVFAGDPPLTLEWASLAPAP